MLVLAFIVLLGGVACSVRVVFIIHVGVNHSLAVPLIRKYGMDPTGGFFQLLAKKAMYFDTNHGQKYLQPQKKQ